MAKLEPGSPEWWMNRLVDMLADDKKTLSLWWRYHAGDHPMPELPEKIREKLLPAYNAMLRRARANFMRMVVEAYCDRMRPIGFWNSKDERDELSWQIWQASKLDGEIPTAFTWELARGRSYLSVWREDRDDLARIAVESPTQTIVAHTPGSRYLRDAGLRTYHDDVANEDVAVVYLPESADWPAGAYEFRKGTTAGNPVPGLGGYTQSEFWETPGGYKGVPIIPLYNRAEVDPTEKLKDRPVLKWGGDSEIADLAFIQDRINETIFNTHLAGWYAAFRQKWAAGLTVDEVPKVDADGNPVLDAAGEPVMEAVEPFDLGSDRLLVSDSAETKFGDFGQTDLGGYISLRERDLEDITIISRIPRHYLVQQGQAPSGDSMVSAEVGFVGRIRRKLNESSDPIEEAVSVARQMSGADPLPVDAELRWDSPENQSLAQLTDSVLKEYQAGLITWQVALERLNYTPQQIRDMRTERQGEDLLRAALTLDGDPDRDPDPEPVA
jgi:hypothetical protein